MKGGYSMMLRCFSVPDETEKVVFYPGDTKESRKDIGGQDTLTVFSSDYVRLLQPYLQLVLPQAGGSYDGRIARSQWERVIREIEHDMGKIQFDDTVFDFYTGFAGWLTKTLEETDKIHVDRNR